MTNDCPYGEHGQLCERVDNMRDELKQSRLDHADLWCSIKEKAPLGLTLWLIGGVFFVLASMVGWGAYLWTGINTNSSCLAVMQSDLRHISKTVEKIDRRLGRIPVPRPHENHDNGEQ